jgi:FkbH-like protein
MNSPTNENKEIKVCINASFTAEPIEQCLKHLGNYFGYTLSVSFTPVNQVLQELIQAQEIFDKTFDAYIILFRIEDLLFGATAVTEEDEYNLKQFAATFIEVVGKFSVNRNVVLPVFPVSDLFSGEDKAKLEKITALYTSQLKSMATVQMPDLTNLANIFQISAPYDNIAYKEAWIPFKEEYYQVLSFMVFRYIVAFTNNPFKVILVDCDNTLWKGVCGEEGPLGVKVEKPYRQLQQILLKKSKEGFLLGIISKNNEPDVWEVFEKNEGMVLKRSDFLGFRINWNNKSENIRSLVGELNLGLDSVIFIDDDIKECYEVMEGCPQVFTLLLPGNTDLISAFIEWNWVFDKSKITREDLGRAESYKSEQVRAKELANAKTVKEFLRGLDIQVSFRKSEPVEIPRLSQLTYRTNQFNVSTIRRTDKELEALFADAQYTCWTVEVSDKFSAYGIVGLLITMAREENLFLETFLLSCRALGRGVEDVILTALKRYCIENAVKNLEADFYPTEKNQPVLQFLEKRWVKKNGTGACTIYTVDITNINEDDYPGKLHYNEPVKQERTIVKNVIDHNVVEITYAGSSPIDQFWNPSLKTGHLTHQKYYLPFELKDYREVSTFFHQKNGNGNAPENNGICSQVEALLTNYPGITRVSARFNEQQDGALLIYYSTLQNISTLKLRKFLNEQGTIGHALSFIQVHHPNNWPAPTNGVVTGNSDSGVANTNFENIVIKIWQEVLEGIEVSVTDNFFDIGGNSFQLIKVISKLEHRYNIRPTFKDFFNTTLRQFCFNLSKDFQDEITKINQTGKFVI